MTNAFGPLEVIKMMAVATERRVSVLDKTSVGQAELGSTAR